VSRLSIVLICALLGALALTTSTAGAATSKYCRLISDRDLGRPVGVTKLSVRSSAIPNPSITGAKGTLTLCQFVGGGNLGVVAQTSVARLGSAGAARKEFDALVKNARTQNHLKTTRMAGPWTIGFLLGPEDGLLVTKGRYIFHIQYASGAPGFSKITPKTLAGLAGKATRKL
jgi:hypothetical protein